MFGRKRHTTTVITVVAFLCIFVSGFKDSTDSINCNFESNTTCGWYDPNGGTRWILANNASNIDPGHDHTCHQVGGGRSGGGGNECLWLTTQAASSAMQDFILISPPISGGTKNISCFTFWYHFFSLGQSVFEIRVNTARAFGGEVVFARYTPVSNNWAFGYVNIPPPPTSNGTLFYIVIHAQLITKFPDRVGLDDLVFTANHQCPPTPDCDFELGRMCGWYTGSGDGDGSDTAVSIAHNEPITYDHTTRSSIGHYLLLVAPSGDDHHRPHHGTVTESLKRLTENFHNSHYSMCFKFWYYFHYPEGSYESDSYIRINVTNLTDKLSSNSMKQIGIHTVAANGGANRWQPVFYTLTNEMIAEAGGNDNKINLTITLLTGGDTSIGLDDFLVESAPCENNGRCEFESDMCGWQTSGDILWLRSQASTATTSNSDSSTATVTKWAPKHDHTSPNSDTGWYLMLPAEYLTPNAYYARIRSPPIEFYHYSLATRACVSFFYFAYQNSTPTKTPIKTPILNVKVYDLTQNERVLASSLVYTAPKPEWTMFELFVPHVPPVFSVQIYTVYQAVGIQSVIALDDVYIDTNQCSNVVWPTPKPTLDPVQERQWDCTFDKNNNETITGCSGWRWDRKFWSLTSYRKLPPTVDGPRTDQTVGTPEGGYLLYMPNAQTEYLANNATADIISTINSTLLTTIDRHCLTFWYFDSTESLFELRINFVTKSTTETLRIIRPNFASRQWKMIKEDFDVTLKGMQYIQFEFRTKGNGLVNTSFAIDTIRVHPNECGHIDGYVYDFDSAQHSLDNFVLARITPLKQDMGVIYLYGDSNDRTHYPYAPVHDHTSPFGDGGYFLFMNHVKQYNITYEDWLMIDNLPGIGDRFSPHKRCTTFAYQLYGNVTLEIFIIDEYANSLPYQGVFVVQHPQTNWVVTQFGYERYDSHKMVFRMVKSSYDLHSYVALDDIRLSERQCESAVDCDFDTDTCSYWSMFGGDNDNDKVNYDFARFIAPPTTATWPGPSYDHTKRGFGGGYLYMTGWSQSSLSNNDSSSSFHRWISRVETPVVQGVTSGCVSLFTQLTNTDAVLNVWIGLFVSSGNGGSDRQMIQLLSINDTQESKWTRHYVDLNLNKFTSSSYDTEFQIIVEGETQHATTVIAIDDVAMLYRSCDQMVKFKCKNGERIDSDLVCNFHPDCSNGTDEANCGSSCDFESGTCGWINQTRLSYTESTRGWWVVMKPSTNTVSGNGTQRLPTVDGSNNATGHYLMLTPYPSSDAAFITYTKLTRNYQSYEQTFKDSYLTCTMTFEYYIQLSNSGGANDSYAQIRVLVGSDEDSSVVRLILQAAASDYPRGGGGGGGQSAALGRWQTQTVYIGSFPGSFVVQFVGSQTLDTDTMIAIDNVAFHNCSLPDPLPVGRDCPKHSSILCNTTRVCIDRSDLCDFKDDCGDNSDESYHICAPYFVPEVVPSCTFEKSLETCGFITEHDDPTSLSINSSVFDEFDWTLAKANGGEMMFDYHGPGSDHTTRDENGQFVILYPRNRDDIGLSIRLISPMMYTSGDRDGDDCVMRMFYFNNGNESIETRNTLRVWIRHADGNLDDSGVLFESKTYLNTWIMGKSRYRSSSDEPFQFVIEGTLGDMQSSISLDDISFTDTCHKSNATYTPSTHKHHRNLSSSQVIIIIIVLVSLFVTIITLFIGGFFAWRKWQQHRRNQQQQTTKTVYTKRNGGKINFFIDEK